MSETELKQDIIVAPSLAWQCGAAATVFTMILLHLFPLCISLCMMSRPSFKDERGAKMSQLTINGQQRHGTAITFLIYGPHPYLIYYVLSSLPSPSHHARGKSSKLERKRPRLFPLTPHLTHSLARRLAHSLTHSHSLSPSRS